MLLNSGELDLDWGDLGLPSNYRLQIFSMFVSIDRQVFIISSPSIARVPLSHVIGFVCQFSVIDLR